MDSENILLALEERDRWREREDQLLREMEGLPKKKRQAKNKELEQIREQVAYYEALAKDMKKEMKPSKMSHLLNSLTRF